MQDQVLQSRRLLRSVCDVQHLSVLSLAGALVSKFGNMLPEVGNSKDRVCALLSLLLSQWTGMPNINDEIIHMPEKLSQGKRYHRNQQY